MKRFQQPASVVAKPLCKAEDGFAIVSLSRVGVRRLELLRLAT